MYALHGKAIMSVAIMNSNFVIGGFLYNFTVVLVYIDQ